VPSTISTSTGSVPICSPPHSFRTCTPRNARKLRVSWGPRNSGCRAVPAPLVPGRWLCDAHSLWPPPASHRIEDGRGRHRRRRCRCSGGGPVQPPSTQRGPDLGRPGVQVLPSKLQPGEPFAHLVAVEGEAQPAGGGGRFHEVGVYESAAGSPGLSSMFTVRWRPVTVRLTLVRQRPVRGTVKTLAVSA